MGSISIIYVVIFFVFLVVAAFFCSAETAFISIQRLRLQHLMLGKDRRAKTVAKIIEHPEKFLATVLLGINFFETGVATLGTLMAVLIWKENLGVSIATIAVTIITLVFVEYVPKSLAARHSEKLALLYAKPVEIIATILYPFVFVLRHIGIRFTGLGRKSAEIRPTISEAEFHTAIHVGEAEGVVEEAEAEMLHKVFNFTDRPVREAMTPRPDIIRVEKGATFTEFLKIYGENTHARFPVYEDSTDNVIGTLFIKDVLKAQADNLLQMDSLIDSLVRPAYFVPDSKPLGSLLADMKKNNARIAFIVDEYGGVAGVITMDQLLEEIVGEIGDELAKKERDIITIDANTFEIDGGLRIEEANEELNLGLPEGDYETIAGFVLSHVERIPKQGENLKYKNLTLTIHEMKDRKIERILVTREQDGTAKS
jgi:putative hemolysin